MVLQMINYFNLDCAQNWMCVARSLKFWEEILKVRTSFCFQALTTFNFFSQKSYCTLGILAAENIVQ